MSSPGSPPEPTGARLQAVLDVARSIGSTRDLDELLERIMTTVTRMVQADRSTLFLVDPITGGLWARVAQGTERVDIRLPRGEGLAGWVATHGEAVVLADAYDDARFFRGWDEETGYRTRSLMCVPFRNPTGVVVGVMQCLNKPGGFDDDDRQLLDTVGGQCAVALENALLVLRLENQNQDLAHAEDQLRRANEELQSLVDLERSIAAARDEGRIVGAALEHVRKLFGAASASALVVGESAHVVTMLGEQIRVKRISPGWASALLERLDASLLSGAFEDHVISAPFEVEGRRIGALQVSHHSASEDGGVRALSLISARVGQALGARRELASRERADRLGLVGQMVSGIVHDLRTPMSAVSGYAELMAEEEDAAERTWFAQRIGLALRQMEEMTSEILQFARGEREIVRESVPLASFVESVAQLIRPELDGFGTVLEISDVPEIGSRFDPSRIRRVIANLARNAGQAGAKRVSWSMGRDGDRLWFSVADDGPGIPEELQDRLFQPFATFGKQGGTGLGLAMARLVVEAHGGRITARSAAGQGTTFLIELPEQPPTPG